MFPRMKRCCAFTSDLIICAAHRQSALLIGVPLHRGDRAAVIGEVRGGRIGLEVAQVPNLERVIIGAAHLGGMDKRD